MIPKPLPGGVVCIVIPGGMIVRDASTGQWRTSTFAPHEAGRYGATGQHVRVYAAAGLYQHFSCTQPKARHVVVPLGLPADPHLERPSVPKVMCDELCALKVPMHDIVPLEVQGKTVDELRSISQVIADLRAGQVIVVTNMYHIARIEALLAFHPALVAHNPLGCCTLCAAEQFLLAHDYDRWFGEIAAGYQTEAMTLRHRNETQGVSDLIVGTYAPMPAAV